MHDVNQRILRDRRPAPPPDSGESRKGAKARAKADKAYAKASRPWYQKKRFIIPGALILVVIVATAISGGDTDAPPASEPVASTSAAPSTTSAAPTETDAPPASEPVASTSAAPSTTSVAPTEDDGGTTVRIGEPANDGKFEFVVNSFECGEDSVGDDPFTEDAQGQFCLVDIQVTNTGDEAQFMFADNQFLHDEQGREFSADSEASFAMNFDADAVFDELNPGNSLTGTIVFDVPADATIVDAELHDSAFSGGVTVNLQ